MAAAVIVPLGLLFFIFGLLVNLLLVNFSSSSSSSSFTFSVLIHCFLGFPQFAMSSFDHCLRTHTEKSTGCLQKPCGFSLSGSLTGGQESRLTIKVFTDNETFNRMGKEHALVVCNHRSDIDWLVGWILAQRSGCLGSALAVTKKSSKFLPVKGWSMWFSEYLFLERNWVKDESTIKSGLQRLKDFPQPFWLALFVEGTRFTETKLKAAQEYAASSELPIPRNVLIPRTKGFVSTVINMRSFVPVIYDMTDALLDKHIAADTFSHQQEQNIGRGSIMGLHTNSRSNEILALVKSLFLMERHGVISAWSSHITDKFRKITVADIIKCAKVSVIPFAVHMGEVCSVHKLKINLYKPEDYPKHTDITEAHLEETMTVMFLRKLEDAEHAIFIFAAYASHITDKFEEDYGSRYYKDYGSVRRGQGYGGGVDLDADAQKRKKQATDEQGYEESCDDEKNEPSFTGGVDDLVMDNEDENTEVAYCGDPQVIWEELHNQLLNSAE
ncbi:hypothetical protein YC2023_052258 [Brassica napus]